MSWKSGIEWTSATWNPVTGCSKISAGCLNCYAERMARRLQAMGNQRYEHGFEVTLHSDILTLPLRWKRSKLIFVNSMSDLFHEEVPDRFIEEVFHTIARADWHIFQVLTKRTERLRALAPRLEWPENLWMGVTVENQACAGRIDDLLSTEAETKFISAEPLLGPLDTPLDGLDWVIVGGESGPNARTMQPDWVRALRDQCITSGVAFFFKQWGGVQKKRNGRILDGRTWDELPYSNRASQLKLIA